MRIQKATQTRLLLLLAIISLGVLSRASTTGLPILDNYLDDGLYAAMCFVLWTIVLKGRETLSAALAMVMVGSMEVFQLSNIPLKMESTKKSGVLRCKLRHDVLDTYGTIVVAGYIQRLPDESRAGRLLWQHCCRCEERGDTVSPTELHHPRS
jgi:hypothetical protein